MNIVQENNKSNKLHQSSARWRKGGLKSVVVFVKPQMTHLRTLSWIDEDYALRLNYAFVLQIIPGLCMFQPS